MANPYDINPYNIASSSPAPTPPSTSSGQAAPPQPFDNTALGIGVNTVKNLALGLFPGMLPADENPYIQTTKDIFQGFARAVGSAGLSITRPFREQTITGPDTLAASDVSQNPTFQKLWQGVFGTTPIPELATAVSDYEQTIKGSSFAQQTGLDKHALPLAFAGVLGGESLNFVPFGGSEEGAVRALARETDPAAISVMLGKMGIDPAVAAKAADHLAQTSDPTEIKATLSTLEGVQATQGAAAPKRTPEEIQQIVGDLTKKSGGEVTTGAKLLEAKQFGKNDIVTLTNKATGQTQERIVDRVLEDGTGIIASDKVSGIPYRIGFDKWDVSLKAKGDPMANMANKGERNGLGQTGNFIADNTEEQIAGGHIIDSPAMISTKDEKTGKWTERPDTNQYYTQKPFEGVPDDILSKIKQGGGYNLSQEDLMRLVKSLQENGYWGPTAGLVYKSYGGGRDVILGTTKIRGGVECIVAGITKEGKIESVRLHGTNINNSEIIGRFNPTSKIDRGFSPKEQQMASREELPALPAGNTSKDISTAVQAYRATFIDEPNANGGLVEISGDEMKKLNGGDYAPERSSLYSKEAYNLVSDEIAHGPKKDIVFLGGGSGSGKSELIGQDLKDSGFTGLLYDNSLSNYSGTKRLLDLAKENGKNVEIHAILPDLDRARFFTLLRAAETGRPVTDADFARSHAGFVETLIKLLENGDLTPEQVHLFDTRGSEVVIPTDVLATLKSARYTEADILKNHGEETVAAKYENIPPPQRLRSLKGARQEAQSEDRLAQKERPADALQGVERGANKEISGSPPTSQERGKAAGESLESEWKQAGFATKKDYEAALRDIASYGESDKSDAVRRIIAGKLPMKPSPSTAAEWKAIFGKRYYSVFKKNAGSTPDDMASQLGYESEHELLHDVADEVYRRYNEKPTRAAAPKGAMRTLTEAIRKPDEVLPQRPMDAKPIPPEDAGLVPRGTTVGEGIQAERPVEDGTPKVIRDQLPPSVGDVIANGRSYAAEQTPAHAMQEIAQGADGKSWQSLVRGYMYNFSKEKKAHIFDYLATPEFVLEKLGLGKGAEMLQDAKDAYRNTLKKEFATIADWQARVKGDPYAKQIIFQYLDGREKEMVREMSPEEHAVAREIRSYLQDWAYRLKLPEDNQLSRYITHIFERDLTGPPESQFVDPELSAIMSENVAKSVYDPFLQKRLGKPGYVEDVWRALDAYVKRAARKEAMDPALERIAEMAKNLDTTTYNYVRDLSHRVNLRPTEIETAMDSFIKQVPWIGGRFTDRPLAFLSRKVRGIFYRGTLGLNFSSTLRNLSQGANTYAKLGEKYTVVGYTKLFTKMAARDLSELSDQNILMDELVQDRQLGVIRKNMQRVDNVLFGMFELAEKINRGAAYYGAKAQALNKGLSEEQAIKYAKRIVRETQFAFGAVDTPVWMNDDLVKTLTQLQTYNVKQAEFLKRMVAQKDFVGLMRWTGSSFAFLYTIGKLFGMTPAQLVPTIGLGGAPLTSTLSSVAGLSASDPQTKAKAITQLQRNFFTLLPAGAQLRKTLQGAHDLERGADLTPAGHVRYPVNPDDTLQALLFGPSSLPQAQDYFGSIGKKKTAPAGNPYNQ